VFDTMITVVGNVVDSPRKTRVNNGSVTNFRLASTSRRFDGGSQRFVDGDTFYVDVECWGDLSGHVSGSVSAGDPVLVVGSISTSEWATDTGRRSKPRIRARAVGHNLHWGISAFTKLSKSAAPAVGQASAEPAESGSPVDPADEAFAGAVDGLTGEMLDEATGEADRIQRGRDYVTDPATLDGLTTDAFGPEPAHV
jgi:single-strand DNA-binding protein